MLTESVVGSGAKRSLAPTVALAAASLVVMAAAIGAARVSGLDIEAAVADPQELTRQRFLGIVSTVGILVWGATVSVCVFAVVAGDVVPGAGRWRSFFAASGLMALVLLVDDLLLVHEFADDVVARFIDFDRTRRQKDFLEGTVFAAYATLFALYAYRYRAVLRAARDLHYLVAAFVLFACSAVIDFGLLEEVGIPMPGGDVKDLMEETPKFVAIVYYAAFYFSIARQSLQLPTPTEETQQPHG